MDATSDPLSTVFVGDGEMAARCRAFDWSATPLGPAESWSQSLRTTVSTLLASRHPMFLWWGPELVQIYNDAYRPSFGGGGRHPRALGARGREFWTEVWDIIGPQIAQVMAGGGATWHEDQLVPIERNGRIEDVWWTYSYSPVRDDDGRIAGTLVVCQETTERVRAFAERDRLLESMSDAFAAFDDEWRYTFLNAEAERLLDRPRGALLGRVVWEVFPDALDTPAWDSAMTARREQRAVEYETFLPSLGKTILARNYPLPGGGVAVVFRDVTAEREREMRRDQLLALAEARAAELAAVIRSMPDAVYIGTASGITIANDAAIAHLGYTEPGDLNRPVGVLATEILTRDEETGAVIPAEAQAFSRALRGERVVQHVVVRHRVTGEDRVVRCAAAPVEVDGKVVAAVAVNTDITAQRRAAAERERLIAEAEAAREAAEAANRAKSDFLAVMSHELRTPLNAIGGYAELIELGIRGPVTAEQREDLRRIHKSQRHLLGLIDEVLNYARVETGAVTYDVQDVPLAETLATCEALTAPQVRAKRLVYAFDDACEPGTTVRADAEKLQQIVLNLLTNAIKFTEPGGHITVRCEAGGDGVVTVTVQDTGRGISRDQIEQIFEPFVQVDARLTRTKEGVGLGLAISRDLARGMGGDLTATSEIGVGSAFRLVLPRGGD